MKPEADQILNQSAAQVLGMVAPLLPAGYTQGTASLLAFMMIMAAQEYERGAEIRAAENADFRALLGELAPVVEDDDLRAELDRGAKRTDGSLKISALNERNADLRRLVIALQMHVEQLPGSVARDAERRIWDLLKASARRRLVRLPAS